MFKQGHELSLSETSAEAEVPVGCKLAMQRQPMGYARSWSRSGL